jgi:hypothetical protein
MFQIFFGSLWSSAACALLLNLQSTQHLPRTVKNLRRLRQAEAWQDNNGIQQAANVLLDIKKDNAFNSCSSGVPIALVGQKGIRYVKPFRRRNNSGAAPATVGGEPFSKMPLGFAVQSLGRLRRAMTREPGDLPELKSSFRRAGRAIGADFRCGDRDRCHTNGGRLG